MKTLVLTGLVSLMSINLYAFNRDTIDIYVLPGCTACHQAESLLYEAKIGFNEHPLEDSMQAAPTIYVNYKFYGVGVEAVQQYIKHQERK